MGSNEILSILASKSELKVLFHSFELFVFNKNCFGDCNRTAVVGKSPEKQNLCDLLWHETFVSKLNNFNVGSSIYGIFQFSGFIEPRKIESYNENRSKYVAKGKGSVFHDAVKQIEEYVSDSNKFKAHIGIDS